jgi:hypothetical protein
MIMWDKPDINGLEITKYEVLFRKSDGTYNSTASCLGDNDLIILKRVCYVTFLTLRSDFGLVLNDLIVAKIRAYNAFGYMQYGVNETGWGLYAENTDGALVKTEPKKPPNKIRRGVLTD